MSFLTPYISWLELLGRLLLAMILGAVVGWEREKQNKPAGLRTHMLVTLGAAAFVLSGLELLDALSAQYERARLDPTRVVEGVVGGIGFLGAGSIIQARGNVAGITTAASVWISGAIGAACGMGAYLIAAVTALLTLITLGLLGVLERRYLPDPGVKAPKEEGGTPTSAAPVDVGSAKQGV